ncbi:MAG: hypothetical protein ACI89X_001155 [Planctomycetota bacterium]|jgi:hypothetical protein
MTNRLTHLLAGSLCSVALSAQVQDLPLQPTNPAPSQDESISIARAAHGLNLDDGRLIGGGGDYKVVFDQGGVMFTPAMGDAVEVNQNLRLTLESVRRGGETVFAASAPARPDVSRIDASIAQYRHGTIVERFDVRADALKQSFVFDRQPAGNGDLIVRLLVDTNMAAAQGEFLPGLTLRAGALDAVHVGAVVGIDATGREIVGHMNYTGSHLELVLPHAFVATANYPLVLDPPISSAIVASSSVQAHRPDIAYEPGHDRYLVVWEHVYSATDEDIRAHFVSGNGNPTGGLLTIDGSLDRSTNPTVCAVAASGMFVVAYENSAAFLYPVTQDNIYGRTVNAVTGALGSFKNLTAVTIGLNVRDKSPSLGGDSSYVDDECILVFESESQDLVKSREFNVSTSGSLTEYTSRRRDIGICGSGVLASAKPKISKDAGPGGVFAITYVPYNYVGGCGPQPCGQTKIALRLMSRNSNLLSSLGEIPGARMRNPQVSGDGQDFIVLWEQAAPVGSKQDIWGFRIGIPASPTSVPTSNAPGAIQADSNWDHTEPAVGMHGDQFVVGLSRERNAPRGPYTQSGEFDTNTMSQAGPWYGLGSIANYSYNLESAIAMRLPSTSVGLDGLIVFRQSIIVGGSVQSADIRVWRHLEGATSTNFGSGCSGGSDAFYELMPGNAFDLSGSAMRLVNNGTSYTAVPGGTYVTPNPGATTLNTGSFTISPVGLPAPFPYPGGSASTMLVFSDGIVAVNGSLSTAPVPAVNPWLASATARFGTWHDFDVPSGGEIKVWVSVTQPTFYVTWIDVHSAGTTDDNTFQMQFDLTTGDVTMVWESMVASGGPWLVGYASGNGDVDGGNVDISASLPGSFPVGLPDLQLDATPPVLGSTCVMTTTNVPSTGLIALQTLSLAQVNPGISLGFLGMPGCTAYANLDAVYTIPVSSGVAGFSLPIPNQANLVGYTLTAQSSVFDPTANAFGFINSNGVLLKLAY